MGWGTGLWGTGAWGFGIVAELSMLRAYATSTRSVRVVLSRSVSPATAENSTLWTVTKADDSTLLVEAAMIINLGDEVELFLMSPLPAYPEELTVDAPLITDIMGVLIGATHSATFTGVLYQTPQQSAQIVDLANSPFGTEAYTAGTINVGTGNDYVEDSGSEFLRKLIMRRLMTSRGEFFHLPNYGIGLTVKEPLGTTDLVKLKKEIETQVLCEPEFDTAVASISLATNGVLTVAVRAILTKTQQPVTTTFDIPATVEL